MGVRYSPDSVERAVTTAVSIHAYGTLGFTLSFDGSLELELKK